MRLELEEEHALRRAEAGERLVEPLARVAGPRRDAEPRAPQHLRRLLPAREADERVGADEEDRVVPLGVVAQQVDRARVLVEDAPRRRGTPPAPARGAPRRASRSRLCPGSAATRTSTRSRPSAAFAVRTSATWPSCGGSNEPPKRPSELTVRARSSPRRPRPRRRCARPAARSARSSSSSLGGVPTTRKPAVGAERAASRAPSARAGRRGTPAARPRRRARPRARGRARRAAAGSRRGPAPVAHESANTAMTRSSSTSNTGVLGHEVDLVQHDDLRPLVEAGAVRGELGVDRLATAPRPASTRRSRGSSMRARSRCARNSWPRPTPSLAPSISPGTSATTIWRPSGASTVPSTGCSVVNGILGDLRPRVRDARQQRRLAGVRQADERRVGEQLQVQLDVALLARHADLREARHLPRRADEARVAAPAAARLASTTRALGCARSAIRSSPSNTCVPTGTRTSTSSPSAPCLRAPRPLPPFVASIHRRRCSADRSRRSASATRSDVAAVAAVAAVGAALRHVLLAPERQPAVAAAAGLHVDLGAVVEHRPSV